FVNRGMIESARTEGEMAGVMAHEISHVALRHGTAEATKSQGAGVQLGAIDETQADVLGVQILARAGYDPMDLARMFETIEREGGSRGPEWLSSHPNPGNREERIAQEARLLRVSSARRNQSGEFSQVQASLRRMPPARTMAEIAYQRNRTRSQRPRNECAP